MVAVRLLLEFLALSRLLHGGSCDIVVWLVERFETLRWREKCALDGVERRPGGSPREIRGIWR